MNVRNIALGFRVRTPDGRYPIDGAATRGGRVPAALAHRIESLREEYHDALVFEGQTPSGEWRRRTVIGDARRGMYIRADKGVSK